MKRQSQFKKKLDPELGRYTRQHIYGEGITDVFKSIGSKLFGKTMKKAAKNQVVTKQIKEVELNSFADVQFVEIKKLDM